jgi:glutamyl-tRNA reductase
MVRHLFRVASGLDSMMIGENQILGQVRDCYRIYSNTGFSHPLFNKLFHQSFACGKRVRTETRLSEGAVSVAYAGVELASKIFGSLENNTALLVGAGSTGQTAARHLKKKNLQKLFITNRTLSKAVSTAKELEGTVVPFEDMSEAMCETDVVVLCTETPHPIITPDFLTKVLAKRPGKPLFFIDLGMPRNCDPACGRLNNVFVYDIDALQVLADKNLARRKSEIPQAEEIVEYCVMEFIKWLRSLRTESTIRALMVHNEAIRQQILNKYRSRYDENLMQEIDALTKSMVKQVFHTPLEKLKEYDSNMKHGMTRLATIQELFDLKGEDENDDDQDRNAKK